MSTIVELAKITLATMSVIWYVGWGILIMRAGPGRLAFWDWVYYIRGPQILVFGAIRIAAFILYGISYALTWAFRFVVVGMRGNDFWANLARGFMEYDVRNLYGELMVSQEQKHSAHTKALTQSIKELQKKLAQKEAEIGLLVSDIDVARQYFGGNINAMYNARTRTGAGNKKKQKHSNGQKHNNNQKPNNGHGYNGNGYVNGQSNGNRFMNGQNGYVPDIQEETEPAYNGYVEQV
jgi:hypothetical protein